MRSPRSTVEIIGRTSRSMSVPDDLPAEVQAARRALGGVEPRPERALNASAITAQTRITPAIDELLTAILSADQVDIVGVLPWQCARRLVELEAQRVSENKHVIQPTAVRYFTPAAERISLYRHSGIMGVLVQRWIAGVTGLRNWLRPRMEDSDTHEALSIFEFDDVYLDCLISTGRGNAQAITILTRLPVLRPLESQDQDDEATLVVTRMPSEQVEIYQQYIKRLEAQASLMTTRQILCRPDDRLTADLRPGSEFRPIILQLYPHRKIRPENTVSPGAIVAVCALTAHGWAVVLKRRNRRNSVEDFDTLSLISERVLDEDLPSPLAGPLCADHGAALDDLWLRAGQPSTFEIPEQAFRHAAQRELFLSCGLDVPDSRLQLRGTCLVERESENRYLGFFVYRLDLIRSPGFDELAHVRDWNPDLAVILIDQLHEPETRKHLNRLLRVRGSWLHDAVFRRPCGEASDGSGPVYTRVDEMGAETSE